LAVAGSFTYWTSNHVGFQGSVGFSPADVAQTDTTGTHDHKTAVVLAGARVLYAFTPMEMEKPRKEQTRWTESHWSFYTGAGIGLVNRSGATWNYSSGFTHPALL